ncbi:MazG nucleotide pyrophosphohydrolase domain-containing protein [Liquorilactobacillus satsumensis]|uniref:Pyrophosphatase n=1 Tax=Liquorilactobacillus satsumensis DSM 16230 = JCM 12392 TaxID=1423801 RepID=A0A0R1UVI4_9LACO|nr:MazG-like family protein [Liquorilactobacillus satsumensis]KRL97232.1 pyrophosphatase [Liquorilactobacillus satsumensis DSM 16230 = JCM 12392]MCC7666876.1 hypothetical protein [Liquorilactobacillus satsumensis]MCP9313654.1 MazG-like family protein [Liquorilactobacillus satsumensis]MCP9328657.1 MazG-like family protein [Liquorilactobacillus satsumensis]MCP9356978.1 MazG-like family protein [Liquorilactobacillus satsumensis]
MTLEKHQQWLKRFYERRGWYEYSPFVHANFLNEETGELARAIRAIEIGRDHPGEDKASVTALRSNLEEELADVLDQVVIISSKYEIDARSLLAASEAKLKERFDDEQ